MNWLLSEILHATGGYLHGDDREISGVSTDTRAIAGGQLFVALRGERFDAHDFLGQAVAAGAAVLLVSDAARVPAGVSALVVDDTRIALGKLAAAWRARFSLPVIAVTGSNGKTTTKEMIAAILKAQFGDAVLATRGNLNNDIGLPLTLLGLSAAHRAAVIEMGMNHPGEIAYLAPLGAPTVAVITNAQRAHLEGMGDMDEVAREKGSIFSGLTADGVAVVNADDRYAALWRGMAGNHPVRSFAIEQAADVRAVVRQHGLETLLALTAPEGSAEFRIAVPGRHNARNAVAAAAACLAAGVPLTAVVTGLESFAGIKGRLQKRQGIAGAVVLDDTYNANPDSVRAGIDVLAATVGHKVLVLGDMGEIGEASGQYHDEIGGYAKSQGIDRLFALGDASQQAVRNFGEGARHFCNVEKLIAAVNKELGPETTVLVKGSRFMKMERVADAIAAEEKKLMLLALTQWLAQDVRFFNVFNYITLRTVLATMTALLISFAAGPGVIRWLAAKKIGQAVRNDGPQTHLVKSGTPTMGGVLILISIGITTLLWGDLTNKYVWTVLVVTLGFGIVGWYDDWKKVVYRDPKGLSAGWKYFWQSALGIGAALFLAFSATSGAQTELIVPFFKAIAYPLGIIGFITLTYFVIVGTSNAVNLTDGLDGLAIMPTVMIAGAFAIFAYVTGHAVLAKYLFIPYVPGAGELCILLGAIAGAGLGFLWFNAYPAEVFMGDVGALSLGAALGTVAVILRQEIVLLIMGGVFVVETLSVMLQVSYFKYTKKKFGEGRRILRMAPLHHHFEQTGWKETQVVVRFWIITIMLVLVGLSSLKLR